RGRGRAPRVGDHRPRCSARAAQGHLRSHRRLRIEERAVARDGRGGAEGCLIVRSFTQLTSFTMIVLGVAMIVVTLVHGIGVGVLLGALSIAAGAARLYMIRRRRT